MVVQSSLLKQKKGLRKGDPMSPFLFVLAMDYLSRLLKILKNKAEFKYHHRCKKLHVVQLGFADNLLLLCGGHLSSVKCLLACF